MENEKFASALVPQSFVLNETSSSSRALYVELSSKRIDRNCKRDQDFSQRQPFGDSVHIHPSQISHCCERATSDDIRLRVPFFLAYLPASFPDVLARVRRTCVTRE
jgi:hypothetical protein